MTGITLELEERHQGLVAQMNADIPEFPVGSDGSAGTTSLQTKRKIKEPNYCKNYGYFVAVRYSSKMVSIPLGNYMTQNHDLKQMFIGYSLVSMLLILMIILYFSELKVVPVDPEDEVEKEEAKVFRAAM
jgi:hypothetical protein